MVAINATGGGLIKRPAAGSQSVRVDGMTVELTEALLDHLRQVR
jgi:hypothetical protein